MLNKGAMVTLSGVTMYGADGYTWAYVTYTTGSKTTKGWVADQYVRVDGSSSSGVPAYVPTSPVAKAPPATSYMQKPQCIADASETSKAILDDYDYYAGSYTESGNYYAWGVYARADGPSLDRGLTLGEAGAGIADIGGDYRYGSWSMEAVTADAKAGLSLDYQGFQIGGRLIGAEGGIKIPLPFTDKSLYVGAGGELFAIGAKAYIDKKGILRVGASALIGGSLSIGIVD